MMPHAGQIRAAQEGAQEGAQDGAREGAGAPPPASAPAVAPGPGVGTAMAGRQRLILHIGTHKTASSTLQALMAHNRAALAARGVCYPRTDRPPFPQHPKHNSLYAALNGGPAQTRAEIDLLLHEFRASGAHTLVLSAEGLSTLPAAAVAGLAPLTAGFATEVVCFLRRPDRFVESLWNQRCKTGREQRHIDDFLRRPRVRALLDYPAMLDAWAGVGRVTALGFEATSAAGLVAGFNAATGLALPAEEGRRRNVSPGMRCAAIMAGLQRRGIVADWRTVEAGLEGEDTRHALGARLRAEILEGCAAQAEDLARRYGVRFPDDLPEEPDAPLPRPRAAELDRIAARLPAVSG